MRFIRRALATASLIVINPHQIGQCALQFCCFDFINLPGTILSGVKTLDRRDSMKRLIVMIALALAVSLVLAACGGAGGAPAEPTYDPAVTPLTGIDLENVSGIANASGVTPCGVFNVNGFGPKVADLSQFPNCSGGTYVVACLNGEAQWVSDYISDVQVGAARVTFTSNQEGTCGLFAAP